MRYSGTNIYGTVHDTVVKARGSKTFSEKDKALTLPWTGGNEMTSYILNKTSASSSGRYRLDWVAVWT